MNDFAPGRVVAFSAGGRRTLERLVIEENARLRSALGQIKDRVHSSPEIGADLRAIWSLADHALRRVPAPVP